MNNSVINSLYTRVFAQNSA